MKRLILVASCKHTAGTSISGRVGKHDANAFIDKAVARSCDCLLINEGVSNVENLGYYNGKFGPLNEMSIPNERSRSLVWRRRV